MRTLLAGIVLSLLGLGSAAAREVKADIAALKNQIVQLATTFQGQADPDYSKQKQLDVWVNQLVAATQPPSVRERLPLLRGVWYQVWGPYNYRGKDRIVDPSLATDQIYQYVRDDGTYYNACVTYQDGDRLRPKTVVLRGEYQFDPKRAEALQVRFTDYQSMAGLPPPGVGLAEVAPLYARGELAGIKPVVPSWIVRLFFGKGLLREVYTDHDLRILYAESIDDSTHAHIYVMTRVAPSVAARVVGNE